MVRAEQAASNLGAMVRTASASETAFSAPVISARSAGGWRQASRQGGADHLDLPLDRIAQLSQLRTQPLQHHGAAGGVMLQHPHIAASVRRQQHAEFAPRLVDVRNRQLQYAGLAVRGDGLGDISLGRVGHGRADDDVPASLQIGHQCR